RTNRPLPAPGGHCDSCVRNPSDPGVGRRGSTRSSEHSWSLLDVQSGAAIVGGTMVLLSTENALGRNLTHVTRIQAVFCALCAFCGHLQTLPAKSPQKAQKAQDPHLAIHGTDRTGLGFSHGCNWPDHQVCSAA